MATEIHGSSKHYLNEQALSKSPGHCLENWSFSGSILAIELSYNVWVSLTCLPSVARLKRQSMRQP